MCRLTNTPVRFQKHAIALEVVIALVIVLKLYKLNVYFRCYLPHWQTHPHVVGCMLNPYQQATGKFWLVETFTSFCMLTYIHYTLYNSN